MIEPFNHFKRHVVPNWRSFKETVSLGELSNTHANIKYSLSNDQEQIDNLVNDWLLNRDIAHAADLVSISFIDGIVDDNIREAADFIIGSKNRASVSLLNLATTILGQNTIASPNSNEFNKVNIIKEYRSLDPIHKKVHNIKVLLHEAPKNPVQWVELSRLYSILGQENKSVDAMQVALGLSPNNRFVIRSATRLFLHYKKIDFIHDFLRKNEAVKYDPWITSAEIAAASLRGRTSIFIKGGQNMISSDNFSNFSLTELSSSLGTIELINGSFKKSRDFFKKSLLSPNDNSLAQFNWAATTDKGLNVLNSNVEISNSNEAKAIKAYQNANWNGVIENCIKWFIDIPYSRRPLLTASYVACVFTNDFDKAVEMCNAGLVSHPNDAGLRNNLAFALALKGDHERASEEINKAINPDSLELNFLKATKGLISYRKGQLDEGRKLYQEVIGDFAKFEDKYYAQLAFLNYLREEMLVNNDSNIIGPLVQVISKYNIDSKYVDLIVLKGQIIKLYSSKFL